VIGREWGKKKKKENFCLAFADHERNRGGPQSQGCAAVDVGKEKKKKTFTLWLPLHDSLVLVAALNGCRVLKKQREEAVQPFAAFTLYPDTFPFFSVWGLPYCRPA
jgi:hypothetical protein